ncbi:Aste57867_9412 [Aphanomyces stellatus]|uniref:Aste57867_9412 protein n=1 Tax=Aphanomyces stellatus TaxID=120398 RepID=A0A485KMT2_9STRA|nr:hypothetical protein As57867_009376 [Aphanomyces stellatus]VFT86292.1 Aste57867_9412 [Aphanomyces stellatus]
MHDDDTDNRYGAVVPTATSNALVSPLRPADLAFEPLVTPSRQSNEGVDCGDVPTACSIPFMILLCLPRFAITMAWAAQWSVLGPLLNILLSSSAVQIIQLVGPISGLVVGPVVGVFCDKCASPFGRRRPYLFWGAMTSILCWVLMMFTVEIGNALGDSAADRGWTTVLTVLCYVWMDITVNITMVPANLILADFAGDRQVTGAVVGGLVAAGGQVTVALYILAFGPAYNTMKSFLSLLIAIMFSTSMAVCWFVSEKRFAFESKGSRWNDVQATFAAVYTGIRDLPRPLAVYFVIMMLTQYGFTAYNGAKGQFFGLVVNGGTSAGADACDKHCTPAQKAYNNGVQLGGQTDLLYLVGVVYVCFLPVLVKRFGARVVVSASILPQTFLAVMAFSKNVPLDMVLASGCSITQATIFPLAVPIVLHVIGQREDNGLGLFAGALNSSMCFGQFLNFGIGSVLVTSAMGYALPIMVGGLLSAVAFIIALTQFHVRMHTM